MKKGPLASERCRSATASCVPEFGGYIGLTIVIEVGRPPILGVVLHVANVLFELRICRCRRQSWG